MEPWSRPVPSRRQFHLPLTRTVPSRQENLSRCTLPSRPVVKSCPYRPVPPSKHVPTVKSRGQPLSLPYLPTILCRHSFPSRCRDHQDAVNTMQSLQYILRIPNTYFIWPSKDVRGRQFRPVTDGPRRRNND